MSRTLSHYLLHPLRQWKAGLLDCMPVAWRNKLAPVVEPYVLELADTQARLYRRSEGSDKQLGTLDHRESHVDAGLASILNSRQAPLLVLLPSTWVLRKQISLPAAALENLGQVIRFEMDRLTPFTADQVYYDYRVEQRSTVDELVPVSVVLVPWNKIESWLSLLDGANISADRISAEGLWEDANFLPEEALPRTSLKQAAWKALPVMMVLILLLTALALPLWQKRNVAMAMKGREVPLKKQANEVVAIRDQLQLEQERRQQLHAAWTRYPPAVDVLKVLTDLLPDDTSLQQVEIKQNQLILRGTSSQASSLISLLEDSSGFSEVKFMSSVVQQRGKEQFHLSANIVMPFVPVARQSDNAPAETAEIADQAFSASESGETPGVTASESVSVAPSMEPVQQAAPIEPVPGTSSAVENSGTHDAPAD